MTTSFKPNSNTMILTPEFVHSKMSGNGFYDEETSIINKMEVAFNENLCTLFTKEEKESVQRAFQMQRLMLMVSELGEACEALRKNKTVSNLSPELTPVDELNPLNPADIAYYAEHYKDTYEDELCDVDIRNLDNAGRHNIKLDAHKSMKMAYNLTRAYKHGKSC